MNEPKHTTDIPESPPQDGVPAEQPVTESETEVSPPQEITIESLQQQVAQLETQATEYKDQWQRAMADFKNYKRRSEAERSELTRSASAALLLKLLPVIDDFERAMSSIPPEIAEHSWWQGTQLIAQKLRTILESEGVTPIDALGEPFDPNIHDAVLYEDAPGQGDHVVAVLQKGYRLHDRVLRPAMVKVGRG